MKNKKIEKIVDLIVLFLAVYIVGTLVAILFYLFRLIGRIRVLHQERFPHYQGKLIVVSNHLSLLEPILLPALFFKEFFFHPIRFSPWSTPDKKNYYDRWYWFWLRPRAVPIQRAGGREILKALFRLKKILNSGGIVILFPEGGRTFKGTEFFYSEKGERIRTLKEGVGWLALKTGALVLPIWVNGADNVLPNSLDPEKLYHTYPRVWRKLTIKIGRPLRFLEKEGKEEVVQKLLTSLLALADEEE